MNSDMLLLRRSARLFGIELTDDQLALFNLYQCELKLWNSKTNLISETTAGEIVTRHFLDSLTAVPFIINQNARVVDIGSGAGFPGIPLKIVLPALRLHLLESNRKKVTFLKHIIRVLKLSHTFTLQERTENIIRTDEWREKFDVVISRAALKLSDLVPLGDHFLAPAGLLIALKGQDVSREEDAVRNLLPLSEKIKIIQHDINEPLLGPPRKIIIVQKPK